MLCGQRPGKKGPRKAQEIVTLYHRQWTCRGGLTSGRMAEDVEKEPLTPISPPQPSRRRKLCSLENRAPGMSGKGPWEEEVMKMAAEWGRGRAGGTVTFYDKP